MCVAWECPVQGDKMKTSDIVLPLHRRAVRNCPWVAALWVTYIRALVCSALYYVLYCCWRRTRGRHADGHARKCPAGAMRQAPPRGGRCVWPVRQLYGGQGKD
jgi:hypothetical protein